MHWVLSGCRSRQVCDAQGVETARTRQLGVVVVLLRFRAANHKSFRDEFELSMIRAGSAVGAGYDGDWADVTRRVAAIYGANASGKTTVLDALHFAVTAIRQSNVHWAERDTFPYHPFKLDQESARSPSRYEMDVVVDGIRHTYGFRSNGRGVVEEWLYSYPRGRRRVLFERDASSRTPYRFGRTLKGENATISKVTRDNALFLSTAASYRHEWLSTVRASILGKFDSFWRGNGATDRRLAAVKRILEGDNAEDRASVLLRVADVGITGVTVERAEVDEKFLELLRHVHDFVQAEHGAGEADFNDVLEDVSRRLRFSHAGAAPDTSVMLGLDEESHGTITWLTMALPALDVLRAGGVLVVDELDSSLHPVLTATLVRMFEEPATNTAGAQLLFSSHDVSLLGKLTRGQLERDEVWFTEKDSSGASQLYSLAEFRTPEAGNVEKRYLEGRFGATPIVDLGELVGATSK
ncbi:hypothetical protein G443_003403 [Actinoalloteichus cyanogriseus DSM 43889]|uniref:ATPase AAA-type core domain-containing protein n=1 Tax=Actinoalloteichus caeruleus DSM 43889 TaxID=1120930 RepID=A0ABT1JLW2_ACTCY|nr:hypothetical protein [Actinoalloteichus caeruleus DSM 43889]